jgi:tetratricopeptide (TPR) repeat protein
VDLASVLRELRRRHARRHGGAALTYRELAAATGWSHGIIGEYLAGRVLPPTDRFDTLVRLFGATPAEQGALATARDRVEEGRRGTGTAAPAPVPRQLPVDVFGFTGRSGQLAELDALLDGPGPAAVISAVAGTAGVGKTALAVRWAHQAADRFPDGQLYVDLRGYGPEPPVPAADALAGFLRGLGADPAGIPAELADRAAQYRTLVAGRRVLVVLDNASGVDQVRPLLPGTPTCFVVVTSRDDLAGLIARDGARRIDLDILTEAEALDLLRALIGARVAAAPAAAAALAEGCARLPLALRIAAEQATANPDLDLAELVADLRDERRRLDLLDTSGDPRTAVRSVFSWSYQHLSAPAARGFGLLGLHPGHDLDAYAVAALAGTGLPVARAVIRELARAHLVEPAGRAQPEPGFGGGEHARRAWVADRYVMHDLMRAYAVERVTADLDPDARRAAQTRLFDNFLGTAALAMDALYPYERAVRPEVPAPVIAVPAVGGPEGATQWLDRQRANLVAVAVYAAGHGWPRHSADLSRVLWRYFEVGGHYQDALAVHTSAAASAGRDGYGRPAVLANLGGVHWWLGHHEEARGYFEQSLAGHRERDEPEGEARALARLGVLHERLGGCAEAQSYLGEALAIYRRTGNRHGEAAQLVNLGSLHRRLGEYDLAAEHLRRAVELFERLGDRRLEGYALGNLGVVESLLGRHTEALAHLTTALAHCRTSGDRGGEGSALSTIGGVYLRMGQYPEALDHLHRALAISRETGDRFQETETLNSLGETLLAMGQPDSALDRYRAALALSEHTGDRHERDRALEGINTALR